MPIDTSGVQPILQKAINLMATASKWERSAAMRAHIVGLQGEKRRLRYLYREARNIVDWIEHKTYDILKVEICAQEGSVDVASMRCPQSTMNGIVEKLWVIYNETHQLANDLVVARFRNFAAPLYKYVECLFNIIGELQRAQAEYAQAAYEYHHISRYQVSWYNVHDEYECKEEAQGYKDAHE